MNQQAMRLTAGKLLRQYQRDANSPDVTAAKGFAKGRLSGAQDMWDLVLKNIVGTGPVIAQKRYDALEELIEILIKFHGICRNPPPCHVCHSLTKAEKLL